VFRPTNPIVWTGARGQRWTAPHRTYLVQSERVRLPLSEVTGRPRLTTLGALTEDRGASAHRLEAELAALGVSSHMGGAPVLGRVEPAIAVALERRGYAVHRVGRAAYVHDDRVHVIFGVWRRRDPAPSWGPRLGNPSAGWQRRWRRQCTVQRYGRLSRKANGRWAGPLPWWRWPGVQPYRWDPIPASLYDHERAQSRASRSAWLAREWPSPPVAPVPAAPGLLELLEAWT